MRSGRTRSLVAPTPARTKDAPGYAPQESTCRLPPFSLFIHLSKCRQWGFFFYRSHVGSPVLIPRKSETVSRFSRTQLCVGAEQRSALHRRRLGSQKKKKSLTQGLRRRGEEVERSPLTLLSQFHSPPRRQLGWFFFSPKWSNFFGQSEGVFFAFLDFPKLGKIPNI